MFGSRGRTGNNASRPSKKALKQLGVDPLDAIKMFLGPKGSGSIDKNEYKLFWQQMSDVAREYVRMLIVELMNFLESNKRPKFPIESICNTIAFITLRFPFKPDIKLKNLLTKWEHGSDKKSINPTPHMIEVIRMLKRRYPGLSNRENTSLIRLLVVENGSNMLLTEELNKLKDVTYSTLHGLPLLTYGGYCFAYSHLREYSAESPEQRQEVLNVCLELLMTLRQSRQLNLPLAQANLLSLLHMVKQSISQYRVDPEFIDKAQQVVKQFYMWPLPYGEFARMLLVVLKKEQKAPGNELLRRFAQESTVPEVQGFHVRSGEHSLRDTLYERCRPVYYLIHSISPHAAELSSAMELDFYEEKSESARHQDDELAAGLPVEVTCLLLLNVINYDAKVEESDVTNVRWLSEEDVYSFFDETVVILQQALEQTSSKEEAAQLREYELRQLKQKIHERAVANSANPPPGYSPVNLQKLTQNFPADFMPPLPPVAHVVMPTRLYYHKSQFRASDDPNSLTYNLVPVPRTHAFEYIEKVIHQFRYFADAESAARIRLVIGGGDQNNHGVVCAWASLLKEYPQYLDGMDIQFFMVPFEDNHLASFIARHDSWYKRHVYTPFRSKQFLLPTCHDGRRYFDNPEPPQGDTLLMPHGIFLREAVEEYVREATQVLPVAMFKVDVWRLSDSEKRKQKKWKSSQAPDKCIPFCQRVDIGIFAELRKHKESLYHDGSTSKKKFDYSPVDLNITVTPVDTVGNPLQAFHDLNCAYQQLNFSNVPFEPDKDACFPGNPTNSFLEMYAEVTDSRRAPKQNTLVKQAQQHVKSVSIQCSNPEQQFSVLIDGSAFGPYYRIDISPLMSNDGEEHLFLPIRTFHPISL